MFSAACSKLLSVKKIIKTSPSVIENIAVDGYLSVGCILFVYSWGLFKQGALDP